MDSKRNSISLTDMQSLMDGFGHKLEIVTDALYAMVKHGNVKDENTKPNTNLHRSSSINSDQESYISKN